jgi:hypothetical protein
MRREEGSITTALRTPSHWVPEEIRITDTYPVYPPHPVELLNGIDVSNDFAEIVNGVTMLLVRQRTSVTGGVPQQSFLYQVDLDRQRVEHVVRGYLGGFADRQDQSAHEHFVALLDEYPVDDCTNYIRAALEAVESAYCPQCGANFGSRDLHRCTAADVRRHRARARKSAGNFGWLVQGLSGR